MIRIDPKTLRWKAGPHVILGKNQEALRFGANRLVEGFPMASQAHLVHPAVLTEGAQWPRLVNGRSMVLHWALGFGQTMHYSQIQDAIHAMYDSPDAFLYTTMSPAAVDPLGFSNVEQVRQTIFFAKDGAAHQLDEVEACAFHQAYEVGIQHVSEVLRAQGFW